MTAKCFVDTNVLIYAFDTGEPAKQALAQGLLDRLTDDDELVLSTQVLKEFFSVVTRRIKQPLTADAAEQTVRHFARFPIIGTDVSLLLLAIARHRKDSVSIWDALIVEAARRAKAKTLYTEDLQDGRDFDGLAVENPFREQP